MNKAWQRYLEMATGATNVTQRRAEQVVKSLVKQGELAAERAEKAVDDLLQRSEENRKAVASIVRSETERAVGRLGLARQRDIDRLERKVERLEAKVAGGAAKKTAKRAQKSSTSAKKSSAKKSTAKKTTGKKSAAKRAKKTSPST